MTFYQHETSIVDAGAHIGEGSKIWHFAHISAGARIGRGCILGQNTMVADGAVLGNNVKVQNNVAIYSGVVIEDDVFLGPSCVLTNVTNPRSQVVRRGIYETTRIRRGSTIGANATIVCGVTLGRYAFVAAGAVVTRDCPDYAYLRGVPARWCGWMNRHGHVLRFDANGEAVCPESGLRYQCSPPPCKESAQNPCSFVVRCLDIDEDAALPPKLAVGTVAYDEFKNRK